MPAFGFVSGLTDAETKAYKAIQANGYNKEKAVAYLKDAGEKEAMEIAEKAEVHYNENKGKLLEVEIPDNDVLLNKEKAFGSGEQEGAVEEAAYNVLASLSEKQLDEWNGNK